MTLLIGRIVAFGLLITQGVIEIGLLIALGKVALGQRRAFGQLGAVLLAAVIVGLWQAGLLVGMLAQIGTELMTGHPAPSPIGLLH
jgi:hypothetical protein